MKLLEQVAQSIVEQTSSLLGVSISITDAEGIVIGSENQERIGTLHSVSAQVIKEGREVVFTRDNVKMMDNVMPGIAVPIRLHHKIIGVLGIIGNPEEVRKFIKFIHNHIEMMLRENFRTESQLMQMKTTELFVQHLIHYGEWKDAGKLHEYCQLIGVHFDKPRLCLIVHLPDTGELSEPAPFVGLPQIDLQNLILHLFRKTPEDIVCPVNQGQWLIMKEIAREEEAETEKMCRRAAEELNLFIERQGIEGKVSIGYGKVYTGLEGASRSYHQAYNALKAGLKRDSDATVYSFDSWSILPDIFFEDVDLSFLEYFGDDIRNIWNHPEADVLVQTFIAYCESNMNVSRAARDLYVHRNTLIYRLNKISEIVHVDPQSFKQCLVLYIALKKKDQYQYAWTEKK